ncbi:hypothetical protein HWV62_14862 [Athelia sp. TMB]|nr:hypothetical protein HWV62_14862 [Athelia sp. TMB]
MSSTIASSAPPSPSLESLGSSRCSSTLDLTEVETPTVKNNEMANMEKKHPLYYFKDGNLKFLIEERLYNVHRYFFERDSSYFRSIFENSVGTDDSPVVISNLSCADFDEFLAILYPVDFRRPTEKTTPQWTSILHLSAKWEFESIKLLAIDNLTANAVPVDKIVLGRRYGISEWLPGAYEAVCKREDPLTVEEGMKLGVEDIIKISAARQAYGYAKSRFEPRHLSQDLGDIFRLEKSFEAQSVGATDLEDEAIKSLEDEVSDAKAAFLALPPTIYPAGTPIAVNSAGEGQKQRSVG